ncbi:MAG: acetylglutamate kinase [Gemmatimonadaceae bacterium]
MRVVKIGGRAQSDPRVFTAIDAMWRSDPGGLCLVHGGGDEISALQRALGREPTFIGGRRVTTAEDMSLVRMILSGLVNKRIVSRLAALGVPALGVSGEDAAIIVAHASGEDAGDHVGVPHSVNDAALRHLMAGGFLPVISPVSGRPVAGFAGTAMRDDCIGALNVNGDDAAAAVAIALAADELLLVVDVPGVLREGELLNVIDADDVDALIAGGEASAGMAAKLEAAVTAARGGIGRVRIAGMETLLAGEGGTCVTRAEVPA